MNARYQPGAHPAYVDARVLVVTDPDRTRELAGLAGGDVTVLGVVDALSRGVLTDLPGFAIVLAEGTDLRVVLRGGYDVALGERTWSGVGVATWTEHLVPGGAASEALVSAGVAGTDATALPVAAGVVLVEALRWRAAGAPQPESAPEPVPEPAPEPMPQPEPEPAPEPQSELPVDDPRHTRTEGEDDFDAMFGATVAGRRPEDAAVRAEAASAAESPEPAPAEPEPETPALGDHDGHTVAARDLRRIKRQAVAAETPVAQRATLALSSGRSVEVDRPVLIGRAPRAAQTSGPALPTLVVVEDPYVSGTHVEVAFQGASLIATDRSTNGTLLIRPGRSPERLVRDVPTVLTSGTVLALSDDLRVTVTVEDL